LLNVSEFDLGAKKAFRRLSIRAKRDLHKLSRWQVNMEVYGAWHGMVLQINF